MSEDTWDQENLTKRNLDFTIESIRHIDAYTKRLSITQMGRELLKNHFDNFAVRIGAYIGEVIKRNINQDYKRYEYDSVYHFSSALDEVNRGIKTEIVLYSKKRDRVIMPLNVVAQHLEGNPAHTDFLEYVEETIKRNS
ncbi:MULTISPECIES: hypothetical protein [unclassified Bacillus (in: firmicutes)]|uniref:hypothetical protein n=1 Tax=unclassified Bacillus (in: firmicutes) TaxID=185979 RepID=UPI0020365886|nr:MULTISPECIES: hypothetical protein [unclassified Bacillus (in: firmicutes)]